jgi:hypothetical protein
VVEGLLQSAIPHRIQHAIVSLVVATVHENNFEVLKRLLREASQ